MTNLKSCTAISDDPWICTWKIVRRTEVRHPRGTFGFARFIHACSNGTPDNTLEKDLCMHCTWGANGANNICPTDRSKVCRANNIHPTDRPKVCGVSTEGINGYSALSVFDSVEKYRIGYMTSVIRPYVSVCQVV